MLICHTILLTWLFMFESFGEGVAQKVKYFPYNMAVFKMYVGAFYVDFNWLC